MPKKKKAYMEYENAKDFEKAFRRIFNLGVRQGRMDTLRALLEKETERVKRFETDLYLIENKHSFPYNKPSDDWLIHFLKEEEES